MKIDPGMHIGLHLVFFGKTGVTSMPSKLIIDVGFSLIDHQYFSLRINQPPPTNTFLSGQQINTGHQPN
jgi:hypothetical protein